MAGSERVKRAGSEGLRMKEAMNINTSLLCFGNVVRQLYRVWECSKTAEQAVLC
jgi:hypothetical protein